MTQEDRIQDWFEQGNTITPLDALNMFGCFRLANVVFNLKKKGLNIRTTMVKNGKKHFAKYDLLPRGAGIQKTLF